MESRAEARRAAEQARKHRGAEAEKTGLTVVDLVILDENAGLGGRVVLQLAKRRKSPIPWTRLDTGSPVILSADDERVQGGWRGVISDRDEFNFWVALPQFPEELADLEGLRVDQADDDVAAKRQRSSLLRAKNARANRLAQLRDVLLGLKPPAFDDMKPIGPLNPALNQVQEAAIVHALSARDVGLIHGPPGTGKTTAVVELIRRAIRQGKKVLAVAPSNMAVDNLLEKLVAGGEHAVRLGHPARVLPQLRSHSLDVLVDEHDDVRVAHKLIKDALQLFRKADRYTRAKPAPGARKAMRDEAKTLLDDARRLEAAAVRHILDMADVLCATTTGLDDDLLGDRRFDLCVIDEAAQSVEPGCWIPILRAEKVVLAGDHCQLPPTIISEEAAAAGFNVSLFERLQALYGEPISRRLTVQYRMHDDIMNFSSREFYDGQLVSDPSVSTHRLCDQEGVLDLPLTTVPVEFIDTAGAGYDEEVPPDGESRRNPQEADVVVQKVRALFDAGVDPADVAVITPYSAQVRHLREKLSRPRLQIDSVDGFQGREKEAVVISLVRSNPNGEIGFLADVRRMNVALTRARRKLILVGDSATLASHPFFGRLLEYCESIGAYKSVWEEMA